jgi:FG-GAP-like repeat/Dockerin type I domain/FG-GAP repeat
MKRFHLVARALVPILGVTGALLASSVCDINGDGVVNISDVQAILNEVLGISPPVNDLNGDGVVNIVDAQTVINSALNQGCSTGTALNITGTVNQLLGVSPFPIAARGATGSIEFTSTTPSVCKTAANLVTLAHTGTCSISASQTGNPNPVSRNFTVKLALPSTNFAAAAGSPLTGAANPNAVAIADFNNDGILDLAIANSTGNAIIVLLGNGSGGFTAAPNSPFPLTGTPVAIAVGDFNADGNADLAVANLNANNVAVLLGNGQGGFTAAAGSPFATGTNPDFVSIGDFNNDGIQDLAISNLNSNNVTVFLGNGAGGFTPAPGSPFTVGTSPQAVVVADFNGDGIQDLAIPNYGSGGNGSVTVLLGQKSGGFAPANGSPFAVGGMASALGLGDFNGDGIPDLAVGTYNTATVAVFLGDGTGAFNQASGSPFPVGAGRAVIAVADFNGDGIQDLAVAAETSNNVTVLLGNGSGGFSAMSGSPFAAGNGPVSVAVGDLNHDGIEDLAIANLLSNNVNVLLGVGSTGSQQARSHPARNAQHGVSANWR